MHGTARQTVGARRLGVAFILVAVGIVCSMPAEADVWLVNAASTGSPNWTAAFPTIQQAVDRAKSGDEVWVAAGTYTSDPGGSKQVVTLKAGVTLYGGFAGTETARDQRDWKTNVTIIDGQSFRRCVTGADTAGVDGFTLRNGRADIGAGMCYGTAANCTFSGNAAGFGVSIDPVGNGGGIYDGTAVNCTFVANTARSCGGGMYLGTASNSTFSENAAELGGGMCMGAVTNGTFTGNSARLGGGLYLGTAANCIIWGNPSDETASTTVTFSCLSLPTPGEGNIVGNPGFVNPKAGDYRLRSASPCIDAGTAVDAPTTDLLGRARPRGEGIDMGAYEYHPNDDAGAVDSRIFRVCAASAADNPDGLTWATAYPAIQPAVDAAASGDELWVAAGTYTSPGDQVVNLKDGITLYGGFTGAETARGQRDWKANVTIIDGEAARGGVLSAITAVVDGCTVQHGNASFSAGAIFRGTAVHCNFIGNTAAYYGGATYFTTAVDCTFTANTGYKGGGMYGGSATNCTFTGNTARNGGAIHGGTATNCTLIRNTASGTYHCYEDEGVESCGWDNGYGGGMCHGTANSCIFAENRADYAGGGIYDVSVKNSIFTGNYVTGYYTGFGGAMSGGTATNCTFTGNWATGHHGSQGGGINGGTVTNCILWNNMPNDVSGYEPFISYSCLTAVTPGTGNIAADPLFVDAAAGDFRLQPGSPCIDTGTTSGAPASDMLGVPRPQGAGVDMGAYEYTTPVIVPDLSGLARTAARQLITAAQLYVRDETEEYSTTVPNDHVMGQHPAAGTQVVQQTPVDLLVSKGPGPKPVPGVWYVSAVSTAASPDGKSWATAYPAIQPAVDVAAEGDEVWVAAGTYGAVNLKAGVTLYGGFAGAEAARDQRDWAANKTIIDGEEARSCVMANDSSTVDGFTLQNGRNSNFGGGMYSGVAIHCTFTGNAARAGGGMSNGEAINCTFIGNHAGGSEICWYDSYWEQYRCHYDGGSGGGMWGGTATNCTFTKNTASHPDFPGGGIASGTATNCILWGNLPTDIVDANTSFSCLSTATPGAGNIVADPLFVNAMEGDFRLQAGSPCIDAGTGDGAPSTDILGVPRPQGAGLDMGAYEYTPLAIVPDLSGLARTAARELVVAAQLYVRTETEAYHPTISIDHVINQYPAAEVEVVQGTPVDLTISKGPEPVPVPDVAGLKGQAATEVITGTGLRVGTVTQAYSLTVSPGTVISQSIAPGTPVLPGAAVDLVVSRGGIAMPDVAGKPQSAADAVFANAGLAVGTVTQRYSATVPAGAVISQTPTAGTPVLPGTPVDLVISRGVQPSVMPDVAGQPRAQGEAAIAGAGLVLGLVTQAHSGTVAAGNVISQSPVAGTEVPPGTVVSIVVSLGPAPVVEGEGEPVDAETVIEALAAAYDSADTDGDGALSFDEAATAIPGLPRGTFEALDTDGDGLLNLEELGLGDGSGCAGCQGGKSAFHPKRLADLFLMALGTLCLGVLSANRRL